VGAEHVGPDEGIRTRDGTVDVTLGGEMHHRVGLVPAEDRRHGALVADVRLDEAVARRTGDRVQRSEIGRVGQLVDVDNFVVVLQDEMAAYRRSDEPGAPGHEYLHAAPQGVLATAKISPGSAPP
jgi:hypothetical protein